MAGASLGELKDFAAGCSENGTAELLSVFPILFLLCGVLKKLIPKQPQRCGWDVFVFKPRETETERKQLELLN